MTLSKPPDTEELLRRIESGDDDALQSLLGRHRVRLRKMVAVRLDPRLAARIDPSDVVQDTLADASHKLAGYLKDRAIPFYPWLRQLAWNRLVDLHRRHVIARRRSVKREAPAEFLLSDDSAAALGERASDGGSSPLHRALRHERAARVRAALDELRAPDREVLVLRFLEQLSVAEISAVLGISVGAVKTRQVRALGRLRELLEGVDFSR